MAKDRNNVVDIIRQSNPIDTTLPYSTTSLSGKTIIITGGASGFGAGFAKEWARHGAHIMLADVSDARGKAFVSSLRKDTNSPHHHYIHCDVTNWQSQVDLFRTAAKLSPTGSINGVVANAGIVDPALFQQPEDYETVEEPPEPAFKCLQVNMLGVMYTTKLALYWLQKAKKEKIEGYTADRCLLLIGSVASIAPIPGLLEYSVSKHGVLGLFVRFLTSQTEKFPILRGVPCTPLIFCRDHSEPQPSLMESVLTCSAPTLSKHP